MTSLCPQHGRPQADIMRAFCHVSVSAGEPRFRHTADAKACDTKEAAGKELWLHFLGEPVVHSRMLHPGHRGDVDLIELVAAEHQARDVPYGHPDTPLNA